MTLDATWLREFTKFWISKISHKLKYDTKRKHGFCHEKAFENVDSIPVETINNFGLDNIHSQSKFSFDVDSLDFEVISTQKNDVVFQATDFQTTDFQEKKIGSTCS